jgi:hypothetical protein
MLYAKVSWAVSGNFCPKKGWRTEFIAGLSHRAVGEEGFGKGQPLHFATRLRVLGKNLPPSADWRSTPAENHASNGVLGCRNPRLTHEVRWSSLVLRVNSYSMHR